MSGVKNYEGFLEQYFEGVRYAGKLHCEGWPKDWKACVHRFVWQQVVL